MTTHNNDSTATSTASADTDAVVKVLQKFVADGTIGDMKAVLAACTSDAAIIDEYPPYVWSGPGAREKWAQDFGAHAARNEISDGLVKLGAPVHVEVTGDRAYAVMRADYSFKMKGREIKEVDAIWTVTLQKIDAAWRINGFSWAKS